MTFPLMPIYPVGVPRVVMRVLVVLHKHVRNGYTMGRSSLTWGTVGGYRKIIDLDFRVQHLTVLKSSEKLLRRQLDLKSC